MVIDKNEITNATITTSSTTTAPYSYLNWSDYYTFDSGYTILDRYYIKDHEALKEDLYKTLKNRSNNVRVTIEDAEIYLNGRLQKCEHLVIRQTNYITYNTPSINYGYEVTCKH